MSTAKRVIKNTGYLYAKMGITMFVSLYTTRLILNGLGASDFGIFNIVGGAIAMLGFLNAAMASATQRFMSYAEGEGNKEKQKYIFNISIVLHAAIALIVGLVLVGAGWFFFNGILTIPDNRVFAAEIVYASLIVSTMFTVMSVPYDAVLNAHENMKYYALVGILESFLKLAVAFACVYATSDKLIVYGVLMACIPFVTLSIMRIYCHRHYEECILAPRRYYSQALMKEMTGFAGWNFLTSVSSILGQYGLGVVVNHFFGVLLNAAQGIANQISGMLMAFSNNMMKAVNPVLVKSEGSQDRERVTYVALFGCRISFLIMAIFEVPMILLAPYVLKIWLKNVPEWAVVFTQLQLTRSLIEQLFSSLFTSIYATGKIREYAIVKSFLNILPLPLTILCFELGFSPYWLYLNWILCWGVLGGFVGVHFSWKVARIPSACFTKVVLLPCVLTVILSVSAYLINFLVGNANYNLYLGLLTPFFILSIGWFVILQKQERTILKSMLQDIITK